MASVSSTSALQQQSAAVARVRINMSWLLKLRRAAVIGQLATIAFVHSGLGVELRLRPLLTIVMLGMTANLALQSWYLAHRADAEPKAWLGTGRTLLGAVLLLDVVLLAALLFFTGGAANPFSIFFFVNLVLSTVVLGGVWLRVVYGAAIASYLVLIGYNLRLPPVGGPTLSFAPPGRAARFEDLSLHALGSMAAFVAVATFTAYFVRRLTAELRAAELALDAERQRLADAARLESLATLAAGAAHELSSPLSTIAVIARELERDLTSEGSALAQVEDTQLIRGEVARCRRILDQMSIDAGASVGEEIAPLAPEDLIEAALSKLQERGRVVLQIAPAAAGRALPLPRTAMTRAVRGLVKNGLEASPGGPDVQVRVEPMGAGLAIEVQDFGDGMDAGTLERAGDPFFTTKDPGRGMGLGLFLVRTLGNRLGGRFVMRSVPGEGTVARLELPGPAAGPA